MICANASSRQGVSTVPASTKGIGGRPTKLTPELAHRIYEYLNAGASFRATCRAVGISKDFRRWRLPCGDESSDHEHGPGCFHVIERLERREDGQLVGTGEFVAFVVLVERALGEHEARLAFVITRAAEKNWRAALEMLRRRYPESWNIPLKQPLVGVEPARIDVAEVRLRLIERVRQVRARWDDSGAIAADVRQSSLTATNAPPSSVANLANCGAVTQSDTGTV